VVETAALDTLVDVAKLVKGVETVETPCPVLVRALDNPF
jgi:F420-0:gamma-glutamyl ligase